MENNRQIIIGIGNPVLTDDAIGLLLCRELAREPGWPGAARPEFREAYTLGFSILDEVCGFQGACFIDSILTDTAPAGSCLYFDLQSPQLLQCGCFLNSHGLNLPALWQLGQRLGMSLPGQCLIIGIAAADVSGFSECLSEPLQAAFTGILAEVKGRLQRWLRPMKKISARSCYGRLCG